MSGNGGFTASVVTLEAIVALINYERARTLYQQMRGLNDTLRGGSVERGLATKIQDALMVGSGVDRDLLKAVYGPELIEIENMQQVVNEVLNREGRSPFFTRASFPTFGPNSPHYLHD